jgi:Na+-dependent bicarbonate transporter superfamily
MNTRSSMSMSAGGIDITYRSSRLSTSSAISTSGCSSQKAPSRRGTKYLAVLTTATCGSVSAVTFVTAVQALDHQQIAYGGHMAEAMALMELPAILMTVLLANRLRQREAVAAARLARWRCPCPALRSGTARTWASCMNRSPMARNCCCSARWPSAC